MGHHYIPRHFLRQFAADKSQRQIWMYDLDESKARRTSITNAASENGYYSTGDEIAMANQVEWPAQEPMEKLRRIVNLELDERMRVATYVSCLINRVPAMRRLREDTLRSDLPSLLNDLSDQVLRGEESTPLSPPALSQFLSMIDDFKRGGYDGLPEDAKFMLTQKIWVSERVSALIASMAWLVLVADQKHPFICSDNPVFWFRSIGMGAKSAEITFPLSSGAALLMVHLPQGPVTQAFDVAPEVVDEINRRTAAEATRFLFAKEDGEWLKRIGEKREEGFQTFR